MFKRQSSAGPIGLDIGATRLRLMQLREQSGEPIIAAAAEYPIPPEMTDSQERATLIRRAIEDALRRHPFAGRDVVCALNSGEYQIKNLRVPRMPPEEMGPAVEFEARERMAIPSGGQVRFLRAGEVRHGNELKEEVVVFAAEDEVIRGRIELLESCRLRPMAIDLAPCAMARSFMRFLRRSDDSASVNAFLEIGWRSTNVVITRGSDVSFLKVIEVGGRDLTRVVGEALSLPTDEALRLRMRILEETAQRRASDQAGVAEEMAATVADAEAPLLERVSREVQMCLRYFAVTFRGQPVTSITFVGGDAHEPVLAKVVGDASEIPCTVGDPLRGLAGAGALREQGSRTSRPGWAVATGLALRGTGFANRPGSRVIAAPAAAGATI